MTKYCSPENERKNIIFQDSALKKMINIWNTFNTDKIIIAQKSKTNYKNLNQKLKKICGNNKYWFWTGVLEKIAQKNMNDPNDANRLLNIRRGLKNIARDNLRPEKPESWYKNPKTWLSNYDIQNVMSQYEKAKLHKYKFLGVVPIDFAAMNDYGQCLYSNICSVNIQELAKKNVKFIGLITNLDKHDEPGSHWTSTFLSIDPKLKSYGAYYYDSTSASIPKYLYTFIMNVKNQCDLLYPTNKFEIKVNKKQHQYKNSECGVFSMLFQIRWINKHIVKKNNTSFEEIIGNPYITDDKMLEIRNTLFRPNIKVELGKKMLIF